MGSYQVASLLLSPSPHGRAQVGRWFRSLTLPRFIESTSWSEGPHRRGLEFLPVTDPSTEPAALHVRLHDFYRPLVDSPRVATTMSALVPMSCTVTPMPVRSRFPMSGWDHTPADSQRRFGYAFLKRRSISRRLLQGPGLFDAAVQWYRLSLHEDVLRVEMVFLASPRFQGIVDVHGRDPVFEWLLRHAPRAWFTVFRDRLDRTMVGHHGAVHERVMGDVLDRQLGQDLTPESLAGLRRTRPPWSPARLVAARAATRELGNKLRIYRLVANNRTILRRPSDSRPVPLASLVHRALALGPFEALWAIEGLGRDHAHDALPAGSSEPGLLEGEDFDVVPACSRLMLHAGLGLSLAQSALARLDATATDATARREVDWFVRQCRRHSASGYAPAALESLGLVTRVFHRRLVALVASALRDVARDVVGLFWHGLGRAVYFTLRNFAPLSAWNAIRMAFREATGGGPRHNTVAGIAWALTLVNQRQPEVLERLVIGPYGHHLLSEPGFCHGVESAVRVRELTTPGTGFAQAFADHRPSDSSRCETLLWDAAVARPARRALRDAGSEAAALFEFTP